MLLAREMGGQQLFSEVTSVVLNAACVLNVINIQCRHLLVGYLIWYVNHYEINLLNY